MGIKLNDSETRILKILWDKGDMRATDIATILENEKGWKFNTIYTMLNRCIAKGLIERREPKFVCHPLIKKEDVQMQETTELVNNFFEGSRKNFLAAFVKQKKLTEEEIQELKTLLDEL